MGVPGAPSDVHLVLAGKVPGTSCLCGSGGRDSTGEGVCRHLHGSALQPYVKGRIHHHHIAGDLPHGEATAGPRPAVHSRQIGEEEWPHLASERWHMPRSPEGTYIQTYAHCGWHSAEQCNWLSLLG